GEARRERMLDVDVPVLVIRGLATKIGIAERDGLRRGRSGDGRTRGGSDEADPVARIDERSGLERGVAVGPIEGRLARRDAAEGRAGVESELAQSLPSVDTAADAAGVRVDQ